MSKSKRRRKPARPSQTGQPKPAPPDYSKLGSLPVSYQSLSDHFSRAGEVEPFALRKETMLRIEHITGIPLVCYVAKTSNIPPGTPASIDDSDLDKRCSESRRLSIEIAEKTQADNSEWSASGIYREDNTGFYLQGNYEIAFIFLKHFLKQLHATRRYKEHEEPRGNPTIRAFYLPFADAEKYGLCLKFKKND